VSVLAKGTAFDGVYPERRRRAQADNVVPDLHLRSLSREFMSNFKLVNESLEEHQDAENDQG